MSAEMIRVTPKSYAELQGVTLRSVYDWLSKRPEKHNATKVEGRWHIYVPKSR